MDEEVNGLRPMGNTLPESYLDMKDALTAYLENEESLMHDDEEEDDSGDDD